MTLSDKETALHWYAHCGYPLQMIAQHFNLTQDELAKELRT